MSERDRPPESKETQALYERQPSGSKHSADFGELAALYSKANKTVDDQGAECVTYTAMRPVAPRAQLAWRAAIGTWCSERRWCMVWPGKLVKED